MRIEEIVEATDERGPEPNQTMIEEFESRIAGLLPEDYRRFLLRCNGGVVEGRLVFISRDSNGEQSGIGIGTICGLRDEPVFSLSENYRRYRGRIPTPLIPIMFDQGDNVICMGIAEGYLGNIFAWNFEMELGNEADWDGGVATASNVMKFADSFSEFMMGIEPNPYL